ncbi:FecR family protein [Flavivirga aquimarina]|uniref:FecR family protein n=1 Tax=Flavivirga aquimarina TaxID=2027862 RepID=A0ABT8W5W6_9FLAO|nr:FecR family protein [Flavivirga aquimarina]MDO5968495.1 FecR family protein [Flavivirga aquimarina]
MNVFKMSPSIENIIVKYLTNSATANDIDKLVVWIEKPTNKKVFKEYVKTHYAIYYSMKEPNTQELLDKLFFTIRRKESFVYKLKSQSVYRYVAAVLVIGLMISAYFFRNSIHISNKNNETIIVNKSKSIKPGTDKAILTFDDGSQVALEKGTSYNAQNVNSNGEEIVYEKSKSESEEIKYNYLTVPRGGQFSIKLSDGTKVWLNSESELKYPVSFSSGKTREVELVYGEAFFDVSASTNHNGVKFIVKNKSQEVEVLGTEFNIKAYLGESNIYTTLVEGSVVVSSGNELKKLKPEQQLNLDLVNNSKIIKTVDVYNEIAWKDGVFSFENKSLKEMMIVLSRWYDVEVIFENEAIENEEFIGILRKNQEIQEILKSIENFGIIKNYKIYDKKIIIK